MSWPAWFTGPGRWQVVFSSSFVGTFSPLSSQNASVISTFSSCIPMTPTRALGDVLLLPFYVAGASALLLAFYAVASSYPFRILRARIVPTSKGQTTSIHCDSENGGSHIDRPLIAALGGPVIYAFKLARFIGCVAFSGLSFVTLYVDRPCASQHPDWPQLAVCTTAIFTSLLALLSITTRAECNRIVSSNLVVILLALFAVYAYRDLFPLITFWEQPQDLQEGPLLWAKVTVLTIISIILPLLCPTRYIPVDPANPSEFPHPEQTASWLSFSLFQFLDPIIFEAQRVSHLAFEKLPPLADYDYSHVLRKRSFLHLDAFTGKRKRHIFFGFMRVFRTDYMIMTFLIVLRVISTIAAPVGVSQLLQYVESSGKGAVVRPWIWIVYIFAGQFMGSVIYQWYIFLTTRAIVRVESIITQLIFEHSLRIRMKAELPDIGEDAIRSTVTTPDSASIAESSTTAESNPKDSSDGDQSISDGVPKKPRSSADNLVGKINNLVTTDLNNIVDGRDFLFIFPYVPLQVIVCTWFLYHVLGWSTFVGLAVMILLCPLPGMVAKRIQSVQTAKMEKTDERVQTVTEIMNVLRMVKLFGWEKKMDIRMSEKREIELLWIWKFKLWELIIIILNHIIPLLTMMASYATFTLIMGQELTASKVFSSMTVFDILRDQLQVVFWLMPSMIQAKVSLDRVNDFLSNTELLDSYAAQQEGKPQFYSPEPEGEGSETIGFRDAHFVWSKDANGALTPSKRKFNLQIHDELIFQRGCINLIVGPTGSGKTSMLMALLGEMHFVPSSPNAWFNLPRIGGVAYAAQESWVQNETIRDNILFGATYDEERYKKVICQCALERDLQLFKASDLTEVGEKGLTLSGGQKARITLARAVYSAANILLLDDILAALDVHTAKWIVDKCLGGDLIKNRTVILVTHNVAMASSVAQYVVSITSNGRVASKRTISEAIAGDEKFAAEIVKEQEALQEREESMDGAEQAPNESGGKLVMAEEIPVGHVSWAALKLYLASLGGSHPVFYWFAVLFLMAISDIASILQTWFLGYWSSQYEGRSPSEVNVKFYLLVYAVILFGGIALYAPGYILYYIGALRASRMIHKKLIEVILGTTIRWLDTTPTSRVITRCTQDIRAIDGPFAQELSWVIELTLSIIFRLFAVVLLTPTFLLPGVLVGIIGIWIGRVYMRAQLSVKREMSIAKAPVLGHFGAAIAGLTSIRAYNAGEAFKEESCRRINRYSTSARTFYNLNRWISIRIDFIGSSFTAALAAYLVYWSPSDPGSIGFSLNMAVGFSALILYWVRFVNSVEVTGNSLERINDYVNIEQEPKSTEGGQPPAYWPTSGDLTVENLSARYSLDGPKVLHDLSFHIKSGERVGIVGRTGSGKSSLTLSLLRCILTDGTVSYDGIPTSSLNLEALRSNITIIPQIPELLSGTLRQNLDPFDQYDDAMLNSALRSAGLFDTQDEADEGRLILDSAIAGGGSNLSVGQRQIIALARAMVRGSKLCILDEATSAIDYKTDAAIQSSLRHEMQDVTQLIIAHRLQTIMDADKIMVLDAGKMVEFGSPKELLQNEKGMLRALVDESGDRETLYAMAGSPVVEIERIEPGSQIE